MVLGPRTKNRKSPTLHLDYLIHIQEVRPWPPSQSLRNLRSVLIQWEHGERNSGSTNPVVPLLGAGVGDGKIEFNESFRLPVTLLREMSIKGGDTDTFQKNCLEFNFYEPRRDKTVRGQLLGTAIIDLADYGIVNENLSISVPINSKRSYGKTAQPVLFLKLQSIEKGRTGISSRDNQSKQALTERNGGDSVSALMDEEYAEEAEFACITDDDVSSHSSLAVSSSAFETNGGLSPNSEEAMKDSAGEAYNHHLTSKLGLDKIETKTVRELNGSLKVTSSANLSPDMQSLAHGHAALSNFPETSLTSMPKQIVAHSVQSSSSSINYDGSEEEINTNMRSKDSDNLVQDTNCGNEIGSNALQGSKGNKLNGSLARVSSLDHQVDEKLSFVISTASQVNQECSDKVRTPGMEAMPYVASANSGPAKDTDRKEDQEHGQGAQIQLERQHSMEDQPWNRFSQDDTRKPVSSGSDALSSNGENLGLRSNILNNDRLKHVKSVRSPLESAKSNGSAGSVKLGDAQNGPQGFAGNEKKDTKAYAKETRNITSAGRIQQLESRIKMLEGELREAAAIEVGLYSVVAEHGSSTSKVHAPARRLSRLYLHVCKESSLSRRASAAKSAVSGLVLVAKACGNDVPRLTFWLSNSVVLRAIISQAFAEQQLPLSARPGSGKANRNKLSPLKWKESSSSKETKGALFGSVDWEDPRAFTSALEKIEAWIFSRIIESIWWQSLTPHMQSAAAKAINRGMAFSASKIYQRTSSSVNQDQVNFSLDLWKKAFKDAREWLCPVRAGGHECGCLPVLARLIMEQCVARLDVAMFNAILRESDDEIPTDPVSDPISDAKVLPIPAGKASFGAGAQLKTAIGNWSRLLTDLFGIDDDDGDSLEDKNGHSNNDDKQGNEHDTSKSFLLLNALSDLMMLPKDVLLSSSNRKEVCPTIGAPLIKRVLGNFVPDEFCSDPIPDGLLEALDSEDSPEAWEDCVTNFPCGAAPIVYLPPPAVSFAGIIGESGSQSQLRRSGSSVLKKSYTSDDELDELDSPLTTIIDSFQTSPSAKKPSWMSKEYGSGNTVRYQLLREVWMNSE